MTPHPKPKPSAGWDTKLNHVNMMSFRLTGWLPFYWMCEVFFLGITLKKSKSFELSCVKSRAVPNFGILRLKNFSLEFFNIISFIFTNEMLKLFTYIFRAEESRNITFYESKSFASWLVFCPFFDIKVILVQKTSKNSFSCETHTCIWLKKCGKNLLTGYWRV